MSSYFFINTDHEDFNIWFEKSMAFAGGEERFKKQLERTKPGDFVFMYNSEKGGIDENGQWKKNKYGRGGIYGVGKVVGEVRVVDELELKYIYKKIREYQMDVDWFLDLRDSPYLTSFVKKYFGWTPLSTVQGIVEHRLLAQNLIEDSLNNRKFIL